MLLRDTHAIKGRTGSNRLVVLVHGWWAYLPLFSIKDVERAITEELPDADLMVPKYPSGVLSNTDPVEVCVKLSEAIELAVEDRERDGGTYEEIILIGFSLGSLIVRKTFVFGKYGTIDHDRDGLIRRVRWAEKVSRMILLAGINRGWSMDPKPKHTPFLIYLIYRAFSLLTTVIPICRLSRSFYRGEPFVENLRIQWHRLERSEPIPPTIQLYGREEDVVTCEDMTDIQFCSHFIFLDVPGTGHFNAANFHQKDLGPRRRRRFLEALKSPIPTLLEQPKLKLPERTKDVTEELVGQNNLEVNDVVFVIHGIRDFGDWTLELPKCIEQIASEKGLRVLVNSPAYKRFPMLRFLLGRSRRKNVRWFVDKYVTALARYPNARFHFIGHSNGTYLLADALQRYDSMRFHRVAFAGSVVRRAYPWDAIFDAGRVTAVRNDRSANDWVVAVFPRFFEQFWEVTGISLGNIGSAGVFGFQDNAGRRHQTLIRGGHGAAIDPKNHPSLVRYILGIDDRPTLDPGVEVVERIPRAIHWLAALSWLWWLILVGSAGLLVCWLLISGHPGLAAASLIAIWWLLNTL